MKHRPELIIFDLDGTLIDTAPDLAYSVDAMLAKMDRPPAGIDKVRHWIGNGIAMLVKRALTDEMWPVTDPDRFREALLLFDELYAANICIRSRLFDGALEGLRTLRAEGYQTSCITNKHSKFTLPLLTQLGIVGYFDFIGCGDQFARHKPDAYPLLKTAKSFRVSLERCLMIGDSENDVQAARAAGCGILCVSYGYRRCERAEDLLADKVIHTLEELPGFLRSLSP